MKAITQNLITEFKAFLIEEEKAGATLEKYIRDISAFANYLNGAEVTKTAVVSYKQHLCEIYKSTSVNSIISSLNSFFTYFEWYDCRVKTLKVQRQLFVKKENELTKTEYEKLLTAAKLKNNERLYLLMQTICSTGIRVSEHRHITVEAVKLGLAEISLKGKRRMIFLPKQLCRILTKYIREHNIKSGPVFISKNGKPLDRSNIWSDMKKLCKHAGVSRQKVFPHNLRHLFARTYYSLQKDIVRLADILGHSSVNTTRIYTIESGEVHRRQIERLGLLKC